MTEATKPDRGPLIEYEVTWVSGHVERVQAHQIYHQGGPQLFSTGPEQPERVVFHGEFDGVWQMVLSILASDVRSIRNVTRTEQL